MAKLKYVKHITQVSRKEMSKKGEFYNSLLDEIGIFTWFPIKP